MSPEQFCDDVTAQNYERNRKLIDFECIPDEVNSDIINTFETTEPPGRGQMYVYFGRHELTEMLDHITDFWYETVNLRSPTKGTQRKD